MDPQSPTKSDIKHHISLGHQTANPNPIYQHPTMDLQGDTMNQGAPDSWKIEWIKYPTKNKKTMQTSTYISCAIMQVMKTESFSSHNYRHQNLTKMEMYLKYQYRYFPWYAVNLQKNFLHRL